MFEKVGEANFIKGEHEVLKFWEQNGIFQKLREQNRGKPRWNFLDGPITANNPMGVHHAWGRTYKDAYQRYFAMTGHELRYQNGFDCQGLWVEVEVEKQLNLGSKTAIEQYGIDKFVNECKRRVLNFAARQTEQSIRLGYWTDWDDPDTLRFLASKIGTDEVVTITTPSGKQVSGTASEIVAKLGNAEWGGSYFTFSTENNETIWTFLKKCFRRGKIYRGYDVMPWSGRGGSAYSQMEVADGRRLTVHKSVFVRFPLKARVDSGGSMVEGKTEDPALPSTIDHQPSTNEFLLVWTTTPWTLTSNVAAAVNPDLDYVKLRSKRDGSVYYFAKDNLEFQRLAKEFKEGFGRPEWSWPSGVPKLKTIGQIFKEQGGYEIEATIKGAEMIGWEYTGPFDDLPAADTRPSQEQLERLERRRVFDNLNQRLIEGIVQHAANDLREIQAKRASSELADQWIAPAIASSNCKRFFEYINTMMVENFGLAPWTPITQHDDPARHRKVLLNLKDFGVSCSLTSDCAAYLPMLDELFNSTLTADSLDPVVDFIGKQPTLIREVHQELLRLGERSVKANHRVIRGGTDSKGSPTVVAGEGTGIVHIAPGCGDVDHTIGERLYLQSIAPLREDSTFDDRFGPFTGRNSTDPATAEFVFEQLKAKHLLVNVEQYPHIYPHCWRTGDELVFRLVDEWFINMDWRDEIKEVTRAIRWLPESINGMERELEWLTSMRDWMISKKRFWGLALPIWVEEYEVNGEKRIDFEVIGSLEELKSRAVEGWDVLEGHTPHRPWIDAVKIKNPKTGRLMSRIVDVGNPWLDAGIVPFSTMQYNSNRAEWAKQYPADFVTECFPGQFRNWFYSLLALATMMIWEEDGLATTNTSGEPEGVSPRTTRESENAQSGDEHVRGLTPAGSPRSAEDKRPFKTLLGHRLVMNEEGQPMHKSDGTAIWFEEAAEQLGVDTMRWMYLAQNPAQDLRFGTRHKDKPVTIETPDGPTDHTAEGLPVCEVVSKPADEVRRQILIPLWNSYSFFVNYARLDEFDPLAPPVPVAERPEIDRWVLSNLQALIETSRREFENYNTPGMCSAAAAFIDDLSNWYIRRNRRRFWRSRDASDTDKLAAYQTLYEVLVTLTKLLAPCVPFVCERMYENLIVKGVGLLTVNDIETRVKSACSGGSDDEGFELCARVIQQLIRLGIGQEINVAPPEKKPIIASSFADIPRSVHLCEYPKPDERILDPDLNESMALAQLVVKLGHKLREEADLRVRQPLAELRFACQDPQKRAAIERLADVIEEELNLKKLTSCDHLDDLVSYVYKPNQKALGPKYGKLLGAITAALAAADPAALAPLRRGESVTLMVGKVDGLGSMVDGKTGMPSALPSTINHQPSTITLLPTDIVITTQQAAEWVSTDECGVQIALSTHLTPELIQEGIARDFVRQVQQLRKDANLEIQARIKVFYSTDDAEVLTALQSWSDYIRGETLADAVTLNPTVPTDVKAVTIGNAKLPIWIDVK